MKKILLVAVLSFTSFMNAQVNVNNGAQAGIINNSNAALDLSGAFSIEAGAQPYVGKGIIIPSVDLVNFLFDLSLADGTTFPTFFDGMIVYNRVSGTTLTAGNRSSTATIVIPGYYYFSNPNGAANGNITAGRWLPLGGPSAAIKSKTVTVVVPANPTTATLALGTATILANEVVTFLGAKIYDSTGANLVMTADAAYAKATNLLTTGNGIMYQVLPAGTYQVVVEYR